MQPSAMHQQNLQTAKDFMKTLAAGDMKKLMTFWSSDGVLEFPFHPPEAPDRIVGKSAITDYFEGTTGKKKPFSFPIKGSYSMLDPSFVLIEFDGELQNLLTGENYTNKYCALFQFDELGKMILFREYFDSLKRQQFDPD